MSPDQSHPSPAEYLSLPINLSAGSDGKEVVHRSKSSWSSWWGWGAAWVAQPHGCLSDITACVCECVWGGSITRAALFIPLPRGSGYSSFPDAGRLLITAFLSTAVLSY